MMIALGKGAEFFWSSNFSRPRINLISVAFITKSCHQPVSVLLGSRNTMVFPFKLSVYPFWIHPVISLLYGGFTKLMFPQSLSNPFTFGFTGHGSKSKWNSASKDWYKARGVFQSPLWLVKSPQFSIGISHSITGKVRVILSVAYQFKRQFSRVNFRFCSAAKEEGSYIRNAYKIHIHI